jgi:hypothetical protein
VLTRGGSRLRSAGRRGGRRASRRANPSARRGAKPFSHQTSSTCTRGSGSVDPRLDPADEPVAEKIGSTYESQRRFAGGRKSSPRAQLGSNVYAERRPSFESRFDVHRRWGAEGAERAPGHVE